MLGKTYRPGEVEAKRYAAWEDSGAFACGRKPSASPYTIVIPPPNVTGSLHMGHALNNTLQDILIRFARMRGRDVLWQPGTDHAGIATQIVVERQLAEENLTRREVGREAFVDRVWQWKEQSGDTIGDQLRRLGASADWSRERFTMDPGLSDAVRKVFVDLYKQGLIYRDKRLVNWDCKLLTAISDLEVEQRQVKGHLWHFKYPIEGAEGVHITVATTRPETMLGDTAVAVHPDDPRYTGLVGKHAVLPLVGRRLPIVADDYADPEQGSGAVKITPGHDFNDFEVARRHGLELINIFDQHARLNDNVPGPYRGLDRFEARDKIVAEMDSEGLLARVEDHLYTMPYGDRSGVAIEPWLTDQWFVNAAALAKPAIEAVKQGRIRFVPKQWEATYFEWMRNIQPWCISRQIWWGHQIPAWYGPDGTIFVEMSEEEARAAAERHYGEAVELERDEDVLDTWFSSALWPFSTLGWPDKTPELERYYPSDVLVTGFDIIFFWVARMIMMGVHFMGEVPFHTVYIHPLVRDVRGRKMSKSKGNIIDPLELIDRYGADALRFTLAALAVQGRDIKLSENRVEGYRNFATKLWNAARYAQMNGCAPDPAFDPNKCRQTVNRWIVGEVAALGRRVTAALEEYRFNEAANELYRFIWHSFCDWYLEFTKPLLAGADETAAAEARAATAWVLDRLLVLLHPIMPFITEELWAEMSPTRAAPLITAEWPGPDDGLGDGAAAEMEWVVGAISQIRAVRAEMNVPPAARIPLLVKDADKTAAARLKTHRDIITTMARLTSIARHEGAIPDGAVQLVLEAAVLILPLAGVVDLDKEKARLQGERRKLEGEIDRLERKLANEDFLAKAPAEVVEHERERLAEASAARARLAEALDRLAAV
ncbi:MAG: valine--tRNA ligase [Alphaproteobacteria bacterium]